MLSKLTRSDVRGFVDELLDEGGLRAPIKKVMARLSHRRRGGREGMYVLQRGACQRRRKILPRGGAKVATCGLGEMVANSAGGQSTALPR